MNTIYQNDDCADVEVLAVGVPDAAVMLGLCESTIRKLVNAGLIPHKRVAGRILFSVEELKKWVADPTPIELHS